MEPGDWPSVAAIYGEGIETGIATFETVVPAYEVWDAAHLDGVWRDVVLMERRSAEVG